MKVGLSYSHIFLSLRRLEREMYLGCAMTKKVQDPIIYPPRIPNTFSPDVCVSAHVWVIKQRSRSRSHKMPNMRRHSSCDVSIALLEDTWRGRRLRRWSCCCCCCCCQRLNVSISALKSASLSLSVVVASQDIARSSLAAQSSVCNESMESSWITGSVHWQSRFHRISPAVLLILQSSPACTLCVRWTHENVGGEWTEFVASVRAVNDNGRRQIIASLYFCPRPFRYLHGLAWF